MGDIKTFKVVTGGGQSPTDITVEMYDRIVDVIYDYAGTVPLASAIGVLELVKSELIRDQR